MMDSHYRHPRRLAVVDATCIGRSGDARRPPPPFPARVVAGRLVVFQSCDPFSFTDRSPSSLIKIICPPRRRVKLLGDGWRVELCSYGRMDVSRLPTSGLVAPGLKYRYDFNIGFYCVFVNFRNFDNID
jgi:hypothetical protein